MTPEFAVGAVLSTTLAAAVILVVRAGRYDWFGDELYFVSAGYRPSVSYVDQGPLVPFVARLADMVAPGSPTALRLPAILMSVASIPVTAALAREFGGGRLPQMLAAMGVAGSPFLVTQSASLSTFAFDATLGAIFVWCVVNWVRTRRDAAVVAAMTTVALAIQVKPLIPVLVGGIVLGVAIFGPRTLPRKRWLSVGVAVTAATAVPAVLWQARHGWPQAAMGSVIRAEQRAATGGSAQLPIQLVMLTGPLGTVLLVVGVIALLRAGALREFRFLLVATAVPVVFVLVSGGRPYYLAGLFPVLFAAGAASLAPARPRLRVGAAVIGALSLVVTLTLVFALPMPDTAAHGPIRDQRELSVRMRVAGTTGWQQLIDTTRRAYSDLSPAERVGAVVVAENYWQAAALDRVADLPPVYSPNRGFAAFGAPPESAATVLYVTAGTPDRQWHSLFPNSEELARLDLADGFPGITRGVTVWRCARPEHGWANAWKSLSTNDFDAGW